MLLEGIFCNLETVFDCVNQEVLLSKLECYGVAGNVYVLIRPYLSGRHQRVLRNTIILYLCTSSDWGRFKHGVPQGSILGPLLLLLYINDLPKVINNKSQSILFAMDTSIIIIINPNPINFKKDINIF
jgi:hypothetical protein